MSNNGKVHVGLIACQESMPDVEDLVRRFPAELAMLKAAVVADQEPVKKPVKKPASRSGPRKRVAAARSS
jgi:diacylglycerol O-acyltransferase